MTTSKKTMEVIARGIEREEDSVIHGRTICMRIPLPMSVIEALMTYIETAGDSEEPSGTEAIAEMDKGEDKIGAATDAADLVEEVTDCLCELTVNRFLGMVADMDHLDVRSLYSYLIDMMVEDGTGESGVRTLQVMFRAGGVSYAADGMDVLEICRKYDDEIMWNFMTNFLSSEEILWMTQARPKEKDTLPLFS